MKIKLNNLSCSLVLLLSCSLLIGNTARATEYLYMENPDSNKYEIKLEGPGHNSAETRIEKDVKFETQCWCRHDNGAHVTVSIVNKKDPNDKCTVTLDSSQHVLDGASKHISSEGAENCSVDKAHDTYWVTIKDPKSQSILQPYRTWLCDSCG